MRLFFFRFEKIKQLETKEFNSQECERECVYAGVNECKHLDEFFFFCTH